MWCGHTIHKFDFDSAYPHKTWTIPSLIDFVMAYLIFDLWIAQYCEIFINKPIDLLNNPLKRSWLFIATNHMVKNKQTVSEGTEVLLTNVRCVVKYARYVGVRRYADVPKVTCRYDGGTLPRWRTRCHGDTVAAWWWQNDRWNSVAGVTVKRCGRCHNWTEWQVPRWDGVAVATVGRCGRCHGETVWQVPRWDGVAGATVGCFGRWQNGMVARWNGLLMTWRHEWTMGQWNDVTVKWLWPGACSHRNMVTL